MAMKTKEKKRNRSADALARGNVLVAFEIRQQTSALIDRAADALREGFGGRCTRVQALEKLIQEGAKKILK